MPPKGVKRKAAGDTSGTATPSQPSLAEQLSYLHLPRPFKNPYYTKNINRRAKNLKNVMAQEREREKVERERKREREREKQTRLEAGNSKEGSENGAAGGSMDAEGESAKQKDPDAMDVDSTGLNVNGTHNEEEVEEDIPTYISIEAPPSFLPQKHYCDLTGLEAPYTDPHTGLRYHDRHVYALIKGLSASTAKEYLSARGVNSIVK
ncbi:chromatin-remodeling complex subunit ies6 [Stygiomarasmius scandens]|uniref:Chromatin-remodeling complex subunit ies6 n=1 Tax=Marasmiellus scandens TaxID=2682957 RepID=A0ABR1JCA4_9AGAR